MRKTKLGRYTESVAVNGTTVYLDEVNVAIDCGVAPRRAVPYIFITHGHADHWAGLLSYLWRMQIDGKIPQVVVPTVDLRNRLWVLLTTAATFGLEAPEVVLVDEVEAFRPRWRVRTVPTYHTDDSVGYLFYRQRDRLKDEYRGLGHEEIARLRRVGTDVMETYQVLEYAALGDVSIAYLLNDGRKVTDGAKTLVVECTYPEFGRQAELLANKYNHLSLPEIVALAETFEGDQIVLIHASKRYKPKDIVRNLDKAFSGDMRAKVKHYTEM